MTKFSEMYPGPKGRHLANCTQTTLTGTYKPEQQKSIHPTGRHKHLKFRGDGELICQPRKN